MKQTWMIKFEFDRRSADLKAAAAALRAAGYSVHILPRFNNKPYVEARLDADFKIVKKINAIAKRHGGRQFGVIGVLGSSEGPDSEPQIADDQCVPLYDEEGKELPLPERIFDSDDEDAPVDPAREKLAAEMYQKARDVLRDDEKSVLYMRDMLEQPMSFSEIADTCGLRNAAQAKWLYEKARKKLARRLPHIDFE